jgi:hypothetical protein
MPRHCERRPGVHASSLRAETRGPCLVIASGAWQSSARAGSSAGSPRRKLLAMTNWGQAPRDDGQVSLRPTPSLRAKRGNPVPLPPQRVQPYTAKPSHSCSDVCHRSRLWAIEYSVSGVASPVLKSTGYAVTRPPGGRFLGWCVSRPPA